MPGNQGTVQPSASQDHEPIKPLPPEDLWEKMDALEGDNAVPNIRPEGVFTVSEYAQRRGISMQRAQSRLYDLFRDGKLGRTRFTHDAHAVFGYYPIDHPQEQHS